jgi:chondroitin AC lyase
MRAVRWNRLIAVAVLPLMSAVTRPADAADLARLRANVRGLLIGPQPATVPGFIVLPESVEDDLRSMRPDGSWADQDYADTDRVHWKALAHLARLERITRAHYRAGGKDPATRERILTSLGYWLRADPHNVNWWHNEIGVPRQVAAILVMLGDDAPPDLRRRGDVVMRRANWTRQTGANLLDETWIQVMRGCVENDPAVVAEAFDRTWQELRVVPRGEEGIQADGSFQQHGPLLYNQGYGTVVLQCVIRFQEAAAGTPFGPSPVATSSLYVFIMDGDLWMTHRGGWDFSACGRGIVRSGGTDAKQLWPMLAKVATFPAPLADQLRDAVATKAESAPVGNRAFWCSDYMVQRRPDYFASVRGYSTRTANTDSLTNGENRKSHHIADGATCLMVTGHEYLDIFPVWDWLRIPGTTVEQDTPLLPNKIRRMGKTRFVGAVSDGTNGCATMNLAYDALSAKKAWFCFDRQMVCLGAGVTCATDHPVLTTLNQCLLDGPVYIDGSMTPLTTGDRRRRGVRWVWHGGIGYVLPDASADLEVRVGPQHGAWGDIGMGTDAVITRNVFSAAIDHGARPNGGTYAYVVLPNLDRTATAAAAATPAVQVVSNTPAVQAVWNAGQGQFQAAFHQPGEARFGEHHVRVDQPCLLMLTRDDRGWMAAVADPSAAATAVNVSLDPGGSHVRVDLPNGENAGRTATARLPAIR